MPALRIAILIFFAFCYFVCVPQEKAKSGPREKSVKEELKSNRKIRFEKREQRRKERAEKKAIKKYHKRLQTKTVRKRMKKSKRSASRYNDNKREFFIVRWFKKHKK